jgi:hypothetical protein
MNPSHLEARIELLESDVRSLTETVNTLKKLLISNQSQMTAATVNRTPPSIHAKPTGTPCFTCKNAKREEIGTFDGKTGTCSNPLCEGRVPSKGISLKDCLHCKMTTFNPKDRLCLNENCPKNSPSKTGYQKQLDQDAHIADLIKLANGS